MESAFKRRGKSAAGRETTEGLDQGPSAPFDPAGNLFSFKQI